MVIKTRKSSNNPISAIIQTITSSHFATSQFHKRAPRLFNALPKSLRSIPDDTPVDTIKRGIDKLLKEIPDEPRIPGYYSSNSSASNRVEDQIRAMERLYEEHHWPSTREQDLVRIYKKLGSNWDSQFLIFSRFETLQFLKFKKLGRLRDQFLKNVSFIILEQIETKSQSPRTKNV